MAEHPFQNTTATAKIFSLTKRIRAVSGGTGASKTISILIWLIDYCQSVENEICTVVAESVPHLRLGAMRDFKNIMVSNGYWNDNHWKENPEMVYEFGTGSKIEFISFDKFGKAHGPRRDVLFMNEANNIPYNIADQLITRTSKIVWADWNPSSEFWFYTEMLGKRDDIDFITLTYKDNEALPETSRKEIESHRNRKDWWQVYGLGQLGQLEGKIYKDWAIIPEIPHEARLECYGVDYGYTNDPTAVVAVYYYNGSYIWDEIAYTRGLSNKEIAEILKNQPHAVIVPDSAEPKSNDELMSYGLTVIPADKGPDSVRNGIQIVQRNKHSITQRSYNIIKEYRNYLWEVDKDGKILNVPEHEFSHSMDAGRYGESYLLKNPNTVIDQFKQNLSSYNENSTK
jgi:phage terminase large subunit